LFSDKLLIHNLGMMIIVWFSSSFTFYLLNFLVKYMPGDIYFNSVVSGLSAVAMLIEGKLQDWLGIKGGMILSFFVTVLATVFLCFFDAGTDQVLLYALVLLLAKSGASLSFGFAYAIHIELFPSHFLISSYGICNFFCRGLTIFAPIVAEVPNPWVPLLFLNGSAIAGFVASGLLKKKSEEKSVTTTPA
jgi:MFS family permease